MRTERVKISKPLRLKVYNRENGICYLCLQPIELGLPKNSPGAYEVDHVDPLSGGGQNHLSNYRPTHKSCNGTKSNSSADVAAYKILTRNGQSREW